MKKKILIICLPFIAILFIFIYLTGMYALSGEFKKLIYMSNIEIIKKINITGSEDIVIDKENGIAFISSIDRRLYLKNKKIKSAIYACFLNRDNCILNLTKDIDFDFKPHGISLFRDEEGRLFIYVINHRDNVEYVEKFLYDADKLIHIKSFTGNLMISMNDLVVTDNDKFYFTNDHKNRSGLLRLLEDYFILSESNACFFNGSESFIAADNINYANGINISLDGKKVYITSTLKKELRIYNRNIETNKLQFDRNIKLKTGVDNIDVDSNDNIWIGSHPKLLKLMSHSKDKNNKSPSQILKIYSNNYSVKNIYLNDGSEISGLSVGAVYNDIIVLGTIFDDTVYICRIK